MAGLVPVHGEPFARIGQTIVAADLHIGIERTLAMRGFRVPSGTDAIVQNLSRVNAKRLVILGDLKDQLLSASEGLEAELLKACEALASAYAEVILVRGNHDAGLPRSLARFVTVIPASGTRIGGVALQHGHTRPSAESLAAKTLAVAHTHPRVELVDGIGRSSFESCWARFPVREDAFKESRLRAVIVMPAVNPLCGGSPVNRTTEPLLGPVLSDKTIDRMSGEIHLLDGTSLGTVMAIAVEGPARHRGGRGRMSYWDYIGGRRGTAARSAAAKPKSKRDSRSR